MASNVYSVAVSGLAAAQLGLSTTSHNIANAHTPGYSRQSVLQSAPYPQFSGSGFTGRGVQIDNVQRAYSQFLTQTVQNAEARNGYLTSLGDHMKELDNLLADPNAGLTPALQDYFRGVQTLASNPASIPARQAMLGEASGLATRFQTINARLTELRNQSNQEITDSVTQINAIAGQIAGLNQDIVVAGSTGFPPNDLLDKRDQLVRDLNQQVKASVVEQGDGSFNVFIGNGQNLVVGTQVSKLSAEPGIDDPERTDVAYRNANGVAYIPAKMLSGGKLAGLLEYRSVQIDNAQSSLGRVAASLAQAMNDQHALGQDLGGLQGGKLFNFGSPKIIPNTQNAGVFSIDAKLQAYSGPGTGFDALTLSDYRMTFSGGVYLVTRQSDNSIRQFNAFSAASPIEFDGITLSPGNGAMLDGDSVLIQPNRNAARDFSLQINDATKLAAAQPVRTEAPVSNTGQGKVNAGSLARIQITEPAAGAASQPRLIRFTTASNYDVLDNTNPLAPVVLSTGNVFDPNVGAQTDNGSLFKPLDKPGAGDVLVLPANASVASSTPDFATAQTPVRLRFTSPTTFNIENISNPAAVVTMASNLTYTPGASLTVNGVRFAVSGTPANNDTFRLGRNANGTADNRNILAMGQLQTRNLMEGGNTTFQGAFSRLVGDVGSRTAEIDINQQAQGVLLQQAEQNQQAVSGVNLDEEAANLIKYQQAFSASSRVIQIAQKAFEEILNLGR